MSRGRFRFFRRRIGQDVRAWPMLALLVMVVLVAIGCVLWFMGAAMLNERLAVREKLAEAYRGHLSLVQRQALERWNEFRDQLDDSAPGAVQFARWVREGVADSVIYYDEQGSVVYPRPARPPETGGAKIGVDLQGKLRSLVQAGKTNEAVQFVIEKFAAADLASALDEQGRLVAANAELLALDLLGDKTDPRFQQIAARLRDRVNDYASDLLPSAQRRFVMHELQRLDPGPEFSALAAEDLAARYLEANPARPSETASRATEVPGVWSTASPSRRVLALLTTDHVRATLDAAIRDPALPNGVRLAVFAPREEPIGSPGPVVAPLGAELPGWRLALFLDDRALVNVEATKRIQRHVLVACLVIFAMSALALLLARGLGRHVELARLKNDLVATVSHELKTPLTAMRALVDTLLDTERLDEKTAREYLQLLAVENARLSRLIDNFLTFSRLERNKFTFDFARLQPQQVVQGAVAAFGERIHAPGCSFTSNVAADLPPIRGDADALVTALLNLLDNAWKYSGDEKRIVLRVGARDGRVCFAVEDHGIGIPADEVPRVFHRFYQVDQRLARVAGGCGLGLSIVQAIVEAHDGTVQVASEPGRGSTFTIEIPAVTKGTP